MTTRVIAVNVVLKVIEAFDTLEEAAKQVPGLDVAEGEWLFFAGDGSPLEAVFSRNAYVDTDRGVYGHGIYTLGPANGLSLQDWLFDFCKSSGDFRFGTLEDFERLFS